MLKATAQEETGTRGLIVEAALDTLKEEGFAGTSARAIARRGGFNQALIFYHFGSVHELLLAALDTTSARRMAAYKSAVEDATNASELIEVAMRIYREDLVSGHITVLAEMIAGSLANPELKPAIVARMEPWVDFAELAIAKVIGGAPLETFIPAKELAYAVVAMYLGVEMLAHLDADPTRIEDLFQSASSTFPLLAPFLSMST